MVTNKLYSNRLMHHYTNHTQLIKYSWRYSPLVDHSKCNDPLVHDEDLLLMTDVVTEDEEKVVSDECLYLLKRRRYEVNHWDQVIIKFKEMERSRWSTETSRILEKVRAVPILPANLSYFPAVHVIELAEDGYIMPHVDAIKFSGRVVAGLNLLSPSIMRFQHVQEENTNAEYNNSIVDVHLPRRSMYMMTNHIRYYYTHEILRGQQRFLQQQIDRTRRISIMIRDEPL